MRSYHLLLTAIILGLSQISQAQQACYTFDEQTVTLAETSHTFNTYGDGATGFLQDWYVTNGTPSVYFSGQLAGVDAFEGDQFVLAGVCNSPGEFTEGLSLSHDFLQGNSYTVSLAIRNASLPGNAATPLDIDFVLLTDTIAFDYQFASGCTQAPAVPGDALVAHTVSGFTANSWQVLTFNVTDLTADFSQLWFRTRRSDGAAALTTFFLMDSVCVTQLPQPSTCYTFDEQAVTLAETSHTFSIYGDGATGFLQDWYVTNGTPSVYFSGQLAGVDAFEGDQFVLAGVCNSPGEFTEGLSLSHDFQQGNSYTVSLAIRNASLPGNAATPLDIDFVLLTDTIAFDYQFASGCTQAPAVPGDAQVAHTVSGFTANSWQVVTFTITGLTADHSQLWFRARRSSGATALTTFFLMDSVCITENGITVGINDSEELSGTMTLYPNPTNGVLQVAFEGLVGNSQIGIYNAMGQQVYFENIDITNAKQQMTLQLGHLSSGVYTLVAGDRVGRTSKRFILQY